MPVSLDTLNIFRMVAETKSFTVAAKQLNSDKARVSRVVKALEQELEVVLLARSTRAVRTTAEGEALVRRIAPLLDGLDAVVSEVPKRADAPSGEVVISTTPELGRVLLAPVLVGFRGRYPSLRVKVQLANELVDLLGAKVDLALRVGKPGGDTLVARKVGELSAAFYAAHSYLERRGVPRSIEQLDDHERLWPTPPKGQKAFAPSRVPVGPSVESQDFTLLAEIARLGGGIALLPTFLAEREVANGTLVRVLPEFQLGGAPLYLVSRKVRDLPARVTAFRSFLLDSLV